MSKSTRDLKRQALAAHRRGDTWQDFWTEHAEAIRQAEPWNLQRYRKLVDHLAHVVLCGNGDGRGVPPWELENLPARQLELFSIGSTLLAVPNVGG